MSAPLAPGAAQQLLPALWTDAPEEARPHAPRLLVRLVAALAGLMILLFALAALVPIGGAVIGGGQVGVETRVKRIAHPTGGVIAAIAVINGQHVRQGELLMRLDDRVTGADATYSTSPWNSCWPRRPGLRRSGWALAKWSFRRNLSARPTPARARPWPTNSTCSQCARPRKASCAHSFPRASRNTTSRSPAFRRRSTPCASSAT
ncbi:biotin/lipoyl-binding protein [Novosphingobium pokkalii]|uniref:biotin/lipoyl-binding protein n=1 Tax=Novosphingobium pokkalii TaxID=1770194 RepID=UPI00363E8035